VSCTVCGLGQLARTDPEAAVAVTLFLGCAGADLEGFKKQLCPSHRSEWAMLLVRGGAALERGTTVTP
jgi:hypothetical protein